MCRTIKNYVIFGIIVIVATACFSIAQQEPNNAVTIKAMPKAIKGFPLVIKVILKGPQKVKYLSINENGIPITVYLKSKFDGNEYVIKSERTSSYEATYSNGTHIDVSDEMDPPVEILYGQKYTMMFDLWSLSARPGTETTLSDVPPGKYMVSVEIETADRLSLRVGKLNEEQKKALKEKGFDVSSLMEPKMKSNPIDIELIEPSDNEKQFIEIIRKFRIGRVKGGVSWVEVLRSGIVIPNDEISNLTQTSKDQLSFHKLISDVNIVDEKLRKKSIEEVNSASLPEFFESERQLLLLELKGNHAAERQNFLKNHSDLKWYVDKFDSGNAIFLGYKEMALRKKKLKEQEQLLLPQEPNSQNEPNNVGSQPNSQNSLGFPHIN
jgi:hypothetical protein